MKSCEELKKLYIVMIKNDKSTWEMATGFYYKLEDVETIVKKFYNVAICCGLEEQFIQKIFYTTDIYTKEVKLISVNDKDEIIIEGGLFENE